MLSSAHTPRHICSSCLRRNLLSYQLGSFRLKFTLSKSKHHEKVNRKDQLIRRVGANLSERTLPQPDGKEKDLVIRRHFAQEINSKTAGQIHTKHSNVRTKKPSLSAPLPTQATPEEFMRVLEVSLQELRKVRNLRWFRLRIGYDPDNMDHANAFRDWFVRMEGLLKVWANGEPRKGKDTKASLYRRLFKAWSDGGVFKLNAELRFSIAGHIVHFNTSLSDIKRQSQVADVRYPAEWWPIARIISRKIHLHIGPTNSGKTYHALQRLIQAKSGVYAGPLRLLAHEVYGRLINAGRSCHLITGDERIVSEDASCMLSSSTVEMVPSGVWMDVAVIDEIQMLGDSDRGWAWTNAFLSLQAAEIHLCGEARSLPLVKALAATTGEKVIVHEYKRLSPLAVAEEGLGGDLSKIQPGDCLVAFSRARIHKYAVELSKHVQGKVAVIYGSLPPDTRAGQARLFNDPDSGYDIVVASNAIGMGLNLNIRRIVFSEVTKFNGSYNTRLAETDVKQIGGRAGRFRVAPTLPSGQPTLDAQNPEKSGEKAVDRSQGLVTTLWDEDLDFVRAQMDREPKPLVAAGLKIPNTIIIKFAAYFPPTTPLSYIMIRLKEITTVGKLYRLCEEDEVLIADTIQVVPGIKIEDRLVICASPADPSDDVIREVLLELSKRIATGSGGDLLQISSIPLHVLDNPVLADIRSLARLERLHKALTLYIWLAFRFESVFESRELAAHARDLTESKITETLAALAETGKAVSRKITRLEDQAPAIVEDEAEEEDSANRGSRFELDDITNEEQEKDEEERLGDDRLRDLVTDDSPPIDEAAKDESTRKTRQHDSESIYGHEPQIMLSGEIGESEIAPSNSRFELDDDGDDEKATQKSGHRTSPPVYGHES